MQVLCSLSVHCHADTLKIWVYYIPLIMQQNLRSTFYQFNFSTPTFQNYDMAGNTIQVGIIKKKSYKHQLTKHQHSY